MPGIPFRNRNSRRGTRTMWPKKAWKHGKSGRYGRYGRPDSWEDSEHEFSDSEVSKTIVSEFESSYSYDPCDSVSSIRDYALAELDKAVSKGDIGAQDRIVYDVKLRFTVDDLCAFMMNHSSRDDLIVILMNKIVQFGDLASGSRNPLSLAISLKMPIYVVRLIIETERSLLSKVDGVCRTPMYYAALDHQTVVMQYILRDRPNSVKDLLDTWLMLSRGGLNLDSYLNWFIDLGLKLSTESLNKYHALLEEQRIRTKAQ